MAKSYTTSGSSVRQLFRGGLLQLRAVNQIRKKSDERVRWALGELGERVALIEERYGVPLKNRDVLEIGHGQFQMALAYLASLDNRAVGIDLDVTPHGLFDVKRYWQLLRRNGAKRFTKNVVRELTGINAALRKSFVKQRGLKRWPTYDTVASGSSRMPFADESFDFIYSYDVFEHVSDPEPMLHEIARVLRPGGTFWMTFRHYAQANALHDLRVITGGANPPAPWAHLVPRLADTVQQGAYVNSLRLEDWRQLFAKALPGSRIDLVTFDTPDYLDRLRDHRAAGELDGYSDEELLCDRIVATWQKVR